ncbi:glycosyl hydrolase [Duganella caerulea]|uniref:glycoside hydrolase family 127 protein n=1 Tax=Duganella caerulea TaxID=2885762 RepID=UPI0030E7B6EA
MNTLSTILRRRQRAARMNAGRRDLLRVLASAPLLASPLLATAGEAGARPVRPVRPFALRDVVLLPGPFKTAQDLNGRYLLSLNPDRLLHNFRANAGLVPAAPVYGGWESQELCPGHTLGHYLSACSMMAGATGDAAFAARVQHVVLELQACQKAAGRGLVCGFPDGDAQPRNALAGRPVTGVPWYTMHKIMAGLRDAHLHAAQPQAVAVLSGIADWIGETSRDCDDAGFQRMLNLEHGGMSEVLADLYRLTGERRYLALAERFSHRAVLAPLAEGRDVLDGEHANTTIPKVIGFMRLHDVTGAAPYRQAAQYFWRTVAERRSFATGGHGDDEHFFPPAQVRAHLSSAKTMETCGTYNMLRLTRALFCAQPSASLADFHERAMFNGILGSQDPDTGMVTYFQPTRPGFPKLYCTPEHSFWCCTGTGMENHAKYGDSIYFHDDDVLVVSLFIASELHWREQRARIRQTTAFPERGATRLTVHVEQPATFSLRLRHPGWCRHLVARVNGENVLESVEPGRYLDLRRLWRPGDVVDIELPMHLHLLPLPGADDLVAVMYGPVVLAARLGSDGMRAGDDMVAANVAYVKVLDRPVDVPALTLGANGVEDAIRRQPGPALSFRQQAPAGSAGLELIPFHRIAHERYSLYWRRA